MAESRLCLLLMCVGVYAARRNGRRRGRSSTAAAAGPATIAQLLLKGHVIVVKDYCALLEQEKAALISLAARDTRLLHPSGFSGFLGGRELGRRRVPAAG